MAGVRTFKDLIAWKLALELRHKVRPLCKRLLESRDFRLHQQIRETARSGPRNIAEGFARYRHRDFARFMRIGKASEVELLNHELDSLDHSARKAIKAANGLIRYLDSTPDKD